MSSNFQQFFSNLPQEDHCGCFDFQIFTSSSLQKMYGFMYGLCMVLFGKFEIFNSDYQKRAKFRQENDFLWQKNIKSPRKTN